MKRLVSFIAALAACALAAGAQTPAPPDASAAKPPLENGLYATIQTSMGDIKVKLYDKESPITVKNFMDLALGRKLWTDPKTNARTRRALYPGTIFHRVIPNFMIQGGDPLGNGTGGTDVIKDEFHPNLRFDLPGKLAMANAGPNSGSCQFFITEVPTPHLNGKHTIFGQVIEGQDLVSRIARVPRGANDLPRTPVKIVKIAFERVGPGEPVTPAPAKATPKKAVTKAATPSAPKAATPPATKTAPSATKAPAKTAPAKK
jgi:peptidyl-prolyl cis-trans isomerase A (cyclophilin A)